MVCPFVLVLRKCKLVPEPELDRHAARPGRRPSTHGVQIGRHRAGRPGGGDAGGGQHCRVSRLALLRIKAVLLRRRLPHEQLQPPSGGSANFAPADCDAGNAKTEQGQRGRFRNAGGGGRYVGENKAFILVIEVSATRQVLEPDESTCRNERIAGLGGRIDVVDPVRIHALLGIPRIDVSWPQVD